MKLVKENFTFGSFVELLRQIKPETGSDQLWHDSTFALFSWIDVDQDQSLDKTELGNVIVMLA